MGVLKLPLGHGSSAPNSGPCGATGAARQLWRKRQLWASGGRAERATSISKS